MNFNIKELNELIYSLGMASTKGMMCDKKLNASLLDKLYEELNSKLKRQANITDEEVNEDTINVRVHFVDNEEADEDVYTDYVPNTKTKERGAGTAQSILDYVESKGSATHKEMHEYYKSLNGSNTFSWCLRNLLIPYKNRKTQRYLVKLKNGKYEVRIANIHNWIVKEY